MRRDEDDLLRGFLALNALLREELRDVRRLVDARTSETKYNPNWRWQPRAPVGTPNGGQWISGGKQAQQRPAARPPQPPRPAPAPAPSRVPSHRPQIAPSRPITPSSPPAIGTTTSLALRLFRLSPLTLAAGLYGDTPHPDIVTTIRSVPGASDLLLVESYNRDTGARHASFQRVLAPRQRTPLIVFGVDTGIARITPDGLEVLPLDVTVDGDTVSFDPHALALAYGQEIPGIATFGSVSAPTPELVPVTPEEQRLVYNLRRLNSRNIDITVALQQFRNQEADTSGFVSRLRTDGLRRWEINHVISELRDARARRPYVRPTEGRLLEIFPGLAAAGADEMVYPAQGALASDSRAIASNITHARDTANSLIREIRTLNPGYQPITFNDPSNFPTTLEGRANYIDRLRLEHAAELFRVNGEAQPLQIEMARYLQRRTDAAYDEARQLLSAGDLDVRLGEEWGVGMYVDNAIRLEFRELMIDLQLARDNDIVRVGRREYVTRRSYKIPDLRVADIYFDASISTKTPGLDQIVGYFDSKARPTYVIIVRPSSLGGLYIITPPSSRFRRR